MVDKAAANKAKNAGNIAFKAKDFDTAITSYNTAIELDPDEVGHIKMLNYFLIFHTVPHDFFGIFVLRLHTALAQRNLNRSFRSAQLIPHKLLQRSMKVTRPSQKFSS